MVDKFPAKVKLPLSSNIALLFWTWPFAPSQRTNALSVEATFNLSAIIGQVNPLQGTGSIARTNVLKSSPDPTGTPSFQYIGS